MDITMYGDQELSLHVLNTEYLYRGYRRCVFESQLRDLVADFTYTDEQWDDLYDTWVEENESDEE